MPLLATPLGRSLQVIVHCAAERRLERVQADTDQSRRLNVDCTRLLAKLCKENNCWLLFISTDYVFDGTEPPYTNAARTNPLNEYGRQKRDAELAAREADWGCGVLRVPLLYGPVNDLDESQVSAVLHDVLGKNPVAYDNLQIRYPTFVDDVAFVIVKLAERKMEHCGLSGVWHWSGEEAMTKYQMAQKMATVFGLDASHVKPVDTVDPSITRPHNAHLDTTTLKLMGISKSTSFEEGLKQSFSSWVKK